MINQLLLNQFPLLTPLQELQRLAAMVTFYRETECDMSLTLEDRHNAKLAITRLQAQQENVRKGMR